MGREVLSLEETALLVSSWFELKRHATLHETGITDALWRMLNGLVCEIRYVFKNSSSAATTRKKSIHSFGSFLFGQYKLPLGQRLCTVLVVSILTG